MKTQSVFIKITYLMLFLFFACLCIAQENKIEKQSIQFTSGHTTLSGNLFLPEGDNKYPAVIILHGGSSNVEAHRSTSTYYAQKFVKKGIATLIYDKRGTGNSSGDFSQSTFDDFVSDAINATRFLQTRDKINPQQIGIFGPSQGGRIAALAAARSHDVAFVASISTPLVSIADLCYFSSMYFIERMGISDSLKILVDPLWIKHYKSVEKGDVQGLKQLDREIEKFYATVDTIFLPLTSDKLDHLKDFRLGDFQPQYNSMTRDYISELSEVKVPWLNIYAEFDEAVPVESSIEIMREQMAMGGNTKYEIKVIPDVNHGFRNVETKKYSPVEDIVIDWILKIVAPSN